MVDICRAKGLDVTQGDGVSALHRLDEDALKAIVCLQVVEHLLTSELEHLIEESFRTLRPGGVLIMETIDPRSLYALGNHFYADITHVRPVHPETLQFMCKEIGFPSVHVEPLSAHPIVEAAAGIPDGPYSEVVTSLAQTVFGHQDYAVIATNWPLD